MRILLPVVAVLTFSATSASALPDLQSSVLGISPGTVCPGSPISITWRVANQGTSTASANGLKLYLSSDSTLDSADTYLSPSIPVGTLSANTAVSGSSSKTLPSGLASGTWYIISEADGFGAIAESNELNNTDSLAFTISCTSNPIPQAFTLSNQAPYCDTSPPPGPAVRLNWTTSANATSYDVYRNGSLYASGIGGTTFLNNANLSPGQTYSYFVRARNSVGTRDSNTINVSIPDVCASPPPPFTLSNEAPYCDTSPPAGPAVRLNWTTSANATSYDVYRNGSLYASGIGGTTFLNNTNLSPGQTYSYFVRARNSVGTRDSNTINVSIPDVCASPPSSFTLTNEAPYCDTSPPAGPAVRLNWTMSANATSYDVYRNGSLYASGIGGTTFLNNTNLSPGQSYSYFVRARNSAGTRDSNTLSVSIPDVCASAPDLVSSVLSINPATAGPGTAISVTWSVANRGSSGAGSSGLKLYLSGDTNLDSADTYLSPSVSIGTLSGNTSVSGSASRTLPPSLASGTWYILSEADGFGAISESNEGNNTGALSFTVSSPPPPFTLSNEAPFCNTSPPAGPAVRLNWTSASGATAYDLFRNGILLAGTLAGTTYLDIGGLAPGQSYSYFVRASSAGGTRDSNAVTVQVRADLCEVPQPPGAFSLSGSSTCDSALQAPQLVLGWTPSSGAATYAIYRDGSLIRSDVAETSFRTSSGMTAGTSYSVFIRAHNQYGSTDSNHVSIAVPADVCRSPVGPPPVLVSPGSTLEPGPVLTLVPTTLQWNAAAGAAGYRVFLSRLGSGGYSTLFSADAGNATSLAVPDGVLAPGGQYRWTAVSVSPGDLSGQATPLYFSIAGGSNCHSLTTEAVPAGAGSVRVETPQNCPGGFLGGTSISLAAFPGQGYRFLNWSTTGGALTAPTAPSTSLSLSGDSMVRAYFATGAAVPKASFRFTPENPQVGQTVRFFDASTGSPEVWSWDLDASGGVGSTAQNPTFNYPAAGPYTVTLSVRNAYGADQVSKVVLVAPAAGRPSITSVTRQYPGLLFERTKVTNNFSVGVDWQGSPGIVRFSVNGGPSFQEIGTASGAAHSFQMDRDFPAGAGASYISMTPINGEGVEGATWREAVFVLPYPRWLREAVDRSSDALKAVVDGSDVHYVLNVEFPVPHLGEPGREIPGNFRLLAGKIGLKETFGFLRGEISAREKRASLNLFGEAGFELAGQSISGRLGGSGTVRLVPNEGLDWEGGSARLQIQGTIRRTEKITDALPALRSLESVPILGAPVRWFGERATVELAALPSIDLAATWEEDADNRLRLFGTGTGGFDLRGTLHVNIVDRRLRAQAWVSGGGSFTLGIPQPYIRGGEVHAQAGVNLTFDALLRLCASATYNLGCSWQNGAGWSCADSGGVNQRSDCDSGKRLEFVGGELVDAGLSPVQPSYRRFGRYTQFEGEPEFKSLPRQGKSATTVEAATLVRNLFAGASPALAEERSGRLLLWVQQDPSLPVLQSTNIAWSYFDGTRWSDPSLIRRDDQVELAPVAGMAANGKIVVAWLRVKQPAFSTPIERVSDLNLFYRELEVVSAVFDPRTRSFGPIVAITEDAAMDTDLRLSRDDHGALLLSWLANDYGQLLSSSDRPSRLKASFWTGTKWAPPTEVASNLKGVIGHAPAIHGKDAFIVIARDPDPQRSGDSVLDLFTSRGTRWSKSSAFAAGGVDNRLPWAAYDSRATGHVVWLRGEDLVHATLGNRAPEVIQPGGTSIGLYGARLVASSHGDLALIWQEVSENQPANIVMKTFDAASKLWSESRSLSSDTAMDHHDFDGYFGSDRTLRGAYLATAIERVEETVDLGGATTTIPNIPQDGRTDLLVVEHPLVQDLSLVGSEVTLAPNPASPVDEFTVHCPVHNFGDFPVPTFDVALYTGDPNTGGRLLATAAVQGPLRAGATAAVDLLIPAAAIGPELFVAVDPQARLTEITRANNTARVEVKNRPPQPVIVASATSGRAPLAVSFSGAETSDPEGGTVDLSWTFGDDSPFAKGSVAIHTFPRAGIFPVTLTATDESGATGTAVVLVTVTDGDGN